MTPERLALILRSLDRIEQIRAEGDGILSQRRARQAVLFKRSIYKFAYGRVHGNKRASAHLEG